MTASAHGITFAALAAAAAALLAAACSSDTTGEVPPGPERVDSAGVALISNPGPDRPLAWRAEETLRLGPADEGPEAFFRVGSDGSGLAADDRGHIYVLDTGHREVRVFDLEGRHLRTVGGPGDGPGELEAPARLFASADGTLAVSDSRKRALVRFAPDGSAMAPLRLPDRSLATSDLQAAAAGGLLFTLADPYATLDEAVARAPRTRRLTHLALDLWDPSAPPPAPAPGTALELASWTDTPSAGVRVAACAADVAFTRPLMPSQVVAAAPARIAWAAGPEYVVSVTGPDGSRTSVRRALPPVQATRELAARDFRTVSIELASHERCEITGARAVEAAGFEPVVPWITALSVAPDGRLFVERRDPANLPTRRIDVFDADGTYLGTLPEAFPFPTRFHGPDTFLRVERGALDVATVVLYRIVGD